MRKQSFKKRYLLCAFMVFPFLVFAGGKKYGEHTLSALSGCHKEVENCICSICLSKIDENNEQEGEPEDKKKKLVLLSCNHIYHHCCFNEQQVVIKKCPVCNSDETAKNSVTYDSFNEMKSDIVLKCEDRHCFLRGTYKQIQAQSPLVHFSRQLCPYPAKELRGKSSYNFLSNNVNLLMTWLKEQGLKSQYVIDVRYVVDLGQEDAGSDRVDILEKPAVIVVVSGEKLQANQKFCFSSVDFDEGTDAGDCFIRFAMCLRTHLMMTLWRQGEPNAFNQASNTFIKDYSATENEVYIVSGTQSATLNLNVFWFPEENQRDNTKLKAHIEEKGIVYADLKAGASQGRPHQQVAQHINPSQRYPSRRQPPRYPRYPRPPALPPGFPGFMPMGGGFPPAGLFPGSGSILPDNMPDHLHPGAATGFIRGRGNIRPLGGEYDLNPFRSQAVAGYGGRFRPRGDLTGDPYGPAGGRGEQFDSLPYDGIVGMDHSGGGQARRAHLHPAQQDVLKESETQYFDIP